MARYALWQQLGSYAAGVDRRLIAAMWPGAAVLGCAVTPVANQMLVNVAVGSTAVPSQNGTGSTLCVSDAVEQVPINGASPQPRIDLVTVHPRANDLDGGANNDFIFDTVGGVPAASPVAPAVPAGQVALAQVLVPVSAIQILAANITDVRGPLLNPAAEPATTSASIVSRTDVNGEVWVAKGGVNGGLWRKARDVLTARWTRSAALTISTGTTLVNMDTVARDTYGLYITGDRFSAPVAGWYMLSGMIGFTPTAAGQYVTNRLYINGALNSITAAFTGVSTANVGHAVPVYMNVGDIAQLYGTAPSLALATTTWTWFSMQYTGTG